MKSVLTSILSLIVCFSMAQSKDSSTFHPKVHIYAGSFFPTINTTLRLNSEKVGLGTQLGLEDNLKMADQKTTLGIDAFWDITRRSGISASFFYLDRSSTLVLDQDITFKDSTYHLGDTITPVFNTSFISAAYRYHIFTHENWNAGLSAGINWLQVGAGVTVEGKNAQSYKVAFPAPTPFIGAQIQGYLSPHFHARYDFSYFGLSLNGVRGRVISNKIMMEYYIFKNIGLGTAFNLVSYNITEIPLSHNFNGNLRFNVNGFSLYVAGRF